MESDAPVQTAETVDAQLSEAVAKKPVAAVEADPVPESNGTNGEAVAEAVAEEPAAAEVENGDDQSGEQESADTEMPEEPEMVDEPLPVDEPEPVAEPEPAAEEVAEAASEESAVDAAPIPEETPAAAESMEVDEQPAAVQPEADSVEPVETAEAAETADPATVDTAETAEPTETAEAAETAEPATVDMAETAEPTETAAAAETAAESGSAEKGEEVEKDWFEAAKEEAEKKEKVGTTEEGETEKDETDAATSSEVFEVEDDGKEFVSPTEVDADAEYFATLTAEELDWFKDHVQDHNKKLQCTACFKQVNPVINAHSGVFRHPLLAVCLCKTCNNYLNEGEWAKDEDGADMYCRWCGQGGDLMLCDKCPHAFCKKCLQRNLGRKTVADISGSEEWKCLVCDPKQIYEQRALFYAIFKHQQELKPKKAEKKESSGVKGSAVKRKSSQIIKMEQQMIHSPENFLDENFAEAVKTLEAYQKTMDEERARWIKAERVLEPEIATSITRKLRKFYAVTKNTMEQLDRAIATAYVQNYPKEAKRIHMGKNDDVIESESEHGGIQAKKPKKVTPATPAKKASPVKKIVATPTPKKKILPKKKVLEAKKKAAAASVPSKKVGLKSKPAPASKSRPAPAARSSRPAPKSAKRGGTVSNGGSNKSYVTPSLMGGGGGSNKKKPTTTKVSSKLFKAKKRPFPQAANSDSESDIEIVADIQPPAKKKKIGPKSRTR